MTLDAAPPPLEHSFTRNAAMGGGVGVVTGLLALNVDSTGVCLAMSVAATVFFAFVVLHEARGASAEVLLSAWQDYHHTRDRGLN